MESDDKSQDITSFITSSEKEINFNFELPNPQDYSSSIDISEFIETEFKDLPKTINEMEIMNSMNSPIENNNKSDDEEDDEDEPSPIVPYSTTLDDNNNIKIQKNIFLPTLTASEGTSSGFENTEFTPNMLICLQQMEEEDRELERLQMEEDEFIAN
ncbi:unnamed protein product [[Candida] boidinii]|nr:unnamed protein product [[Candida] boidinii]